MSRILLGNIKGPKGDKGEQGDIQEYQTQILKGDTSQKFVTNGNVFMYKEVFTKSEIDANTNGYMLDLYEITNVGDNHNYGDCVHTATVYISGGRVDYIDFILMLDEYSLAIFIRGDLLNRLNLEDGEVMVIDYTGIIDFEDFI